MELIILVIVIGVMLLGAAGFAAIGAVGAENRGRARAEANQDAILDELFATDAATVTYDTRIYNHLRPTAVIAGARARGWGLAHDDGGLLLLERR